MRNVHPFSRFEDFGEACVGAARALVVDPQHWSTPFTNSPLRGGGHVELLARGARVLTLANGGGRGFYRLEGLRGYTFYTTGGARLPVASYQLREGRRGSWQEWMVDNPLHWLGTGEFAALIKGGRVLVAGLGLGLVLWHLWENDNIERIVVVERNPEAIELIQPTLPPDRRIEIVCADYYDYIANLNRAPMEKIMRQINAAKSKARVDRLREQMLKLMASVYDKPPFDYVYFDLAVGDTSETRPEFERGQMLTAVYLGAANLVQFGRYDNAGFSAEQLREIKAARSLDL